MLDLKSLFGFFILIGLASCAGKDITGNNIKDEDSVFYSVPVGSSLVLNQDLIIAGDQVAVYVQNGTLMLYRELDKYRPNCKFEVYKISEQPRTVHADTFEIIKVEDDIESSSLRARVQLAALDSVSSNRYLAFGLDHSEVFNYASLMYLNSEKQKDVYRMTCQHWESVMDDKHLSITQMRQAMGEIFTLKIK